MRLPQLNADEIRALKGPRRDGAARFEERIRVHLGAALPGDIHVAVRAIDGPASTQSGLAPVFRIDDKLLGAWVAARFGSDEIRLPVPEHYRHGLLTKIEAAFAEIVLGHALNERGSIALNIELGRQGGQLEIDWTGLDDEPLKQWALKRWTAMRGEHN